MQGPRPLSGGGDTALAEPQAVVRHGEERLQQLPRAIEESGPGGGRQSPARPPHALVAFQWLPLEDGLEAGMDSRERGSVTGRGLAEMREKSGRVWGTVLKWFRIRGLRKRECGNHSTGDSLSVISWCHLNTSQAPSHLNPTATPSGRWWSSSHLQMRKSRPGEMNLLAQGCPGGKGRAWIQTLAMRGERQTQV